MTKGQKKLVISLVIIVLVFLAIIFGFQAIGVFLAFKNF